jgi:sugar (pentulose or hexulose) kinase
VHDPHKLAVLEPRPDDDVKFFQGMLEAMARIEAEGYAKLQTLGASPLKRVLSAGGGSNNIAWCRMRARELGVPVTAATHTKASLGVALLAKQGWMTQHERNTTAGYKS